MVVKVGVNFRGQEVLALAVGGADSLPPASNAEYMKLINSLQQQLYAERDKNKHLKGA